MLNKVKGSKLGRHAIKGCLIAMPIAVAVFSLFNFTNTPPHQFSDSECFSCHFTIPGKDEPRPYRFVDSINTLCRRCHENLNLVSHVVDISPTIAVPPEFPLDETGRITCATCHDPHLPPADPATGQKTYFLRGGVSGKGECQLCHQSDFANITSFTHRPAMDRAHGFSYYIVLDPAAGLDDLSLECLSCHGNTEEPEKTSPGSGVWVHGTDIGASHPIGIDYDRATIGNPDLRPKLEVDPRLVFFDGKIGCCTCHDPYMPGGGAGLRIGERDSFQDLCLACHNN